MRELNALFLIFIFFMVLKLIYCLVFIYRQEKTNELFHFFSSQIPQFCND